MQRQPAPASHLDLAHELQVAVEDAGDERLRVTLPHHPQLGQAVEQRRKRRLVACRAETEGVGVRTCPCLFKQPWRSKLGLPSRGVACIALRHNNKAIDNTGSASAPFNPHLCRSRCAWHCQSCRQDSHPAPLLLAAGSQAARPPSAAIRWEGRSRQQATRSERPICSSNSGRWTRPPTPAPALQLTDTPSC